MAKFIGETSLAELVSKTKAYADSIGITPISTQYIRITDLNPGVYKLTYSGTKYIYYSGTSNTNTHTVQASTGNVILTVNRYGTTYWHWYYINGSTSYPFIYFGYTSSSLGYTKSVQLSDLSSIPSITLNGSSVTSASFYAPTTAISTSTSKRYLVGSSSTTSVATENTNASCYMSGGYLYSNGSQVLTSADFASYLSDEFVLSDLVTAGTNITISGNTISASGGGTATTVKINGTSITSSNVADIKTNGTYNASTNKIATMSDLPTVPSIDSSLSSTSTNPVQNKVVNTAIDNLRKRFNTLSVTVTQNPGANTAYQATALTCVIIWMNADTSGSIANSSGINFWTSPDGSTWTQVARFSSTSGYPKFGNICCVVPKGAYFRTNYWGMTGTNNIVHMTRIVLDNYSA